MSLTLREFFEEHPRVAIAFSGGVDSAYLLYAAKKYAKEIKAYYVKSEFQPQFEQDDALRLAEEIGADMKVISLSVLANREICANPGNRCYYCKKTIFSTITSATKEDGFDVLLDGTNASDDVADRPGTKALAELSVLSPLRECGFTKAEIRTLSKEAGLFTWDKPAYACLATRIPTGEEITAEKLAAIEASENYLFSLGFTDFRIRTQNGNAKIQIKEEQMPLFLQNRKDIFDKLKENYDSVVLDLEVRE